MTLVKDKRLCLYCAGALALDTVEVEGGRVHYSKHECASNLKTQRDAYLRELARAKELLSDGLLKEKCADILTVEENFRLAPFRLTMEGIRTAKEVASRD